MSNDLSIELKHHKCRYKNNISVFSNQLDIEEPFEVINLLLNSNNIVNSESNENNSHSDEENKLKKRSNSNKINNLPDIDDYFEKNESLISWISKYPKAEEKIYTEFLTLLKQIFDKRYKIFPNNVCSLSEYSTHIKNKVEKYCKENLDLSVYILYILNNAFDNFFIYIDKIVNLETLKIDDFTSLKEILHHIGKDVKIIFKDAVNTIDRGFDFKFSNVLIAMLNEYLKKENKLKEPQLIHAALIEERNEFLNCIKGINKLKFTSNLKKWINDIFENDNIKIKKIKSDKEKNINEKQINIINKTDNYKNNIIFSNSLSTKKQQINEIKETSNHPSSYKNIDNISENIIQKEYDNKDVHTLNIEDLVSYINEPKFNTNNKKKAKRKKKSKKDNKEFKKNENNKAVKNERIDKNNSVEEDLIIIDFKKSIEDFTSKNKYIYPKKVEPKISETFMKLLETYNE